MSTPRFLVAIGTGLTPGSCTIKLFTADVSIKGLLSAVKSFIVEAFRGSPMKIVVNMVYLYVS